MKINISKCRLQLINQLINRTLILCICLNLINQMKIMVLLPLLIFNLTGVFPAQFVKIGNWKNEFIISIWLFLCLFAINR